jgi:iron complex outermembrane receptor protein
MKNCLRLLLPLLIYIMPHAATAQNCNSMIFGAVRDGKDRTLLPGAGVLIKETGTSSVTDTDGHYHLNDLCPGKYTIMISYVGYQSKEISITISGQKELNVSLLNQTKGLNTVSIEGHRTELKPLQSSARLDGKALEMTRGETLGESLKGIPGVNTIQTGPTISYKGFMETGSWFIIQALDRKVSSGVVNMLRRWILLLQTRLLLLRVQPV